MMQESVSTQSIDKNIMDPVPSVKESQNSNSTRNILECSQLPRISIAHHGLSGELDNLESRECLDIKKSPDLYSKGKFKFNHVQLQHYLLLDFSKLSLKCPWRDIVLSRANGVFHEIGK